MKNLDEVDFFTETISLESAKKDSRNSEILSREEFEMDTVHDENSELIIKEERINDIRYLNKYFEKVNKALKKGGIFKGNVETYSVRRNRILKKFSAPFNRIYLLLDILLIRVSPIITHNKKSLFSRHQRKGAGFVKSG
jgi:hypothetical protein